MARITPGGNVTILEGYFDEKDNDTETLEPKSS